MTVLTGLKWVGTKAELFIPLSGSRSTVAERLDQRGSASAQTRSSLRQPDRSGNSACAICVANSLKIRHGFERCRFSRCTSDRSNGGNRQSGITSTRRPVRRSSGWPTGGSSPLPWPASKAGVRPAKSFMARQGRKIMVSLAPCLCTKLQFASGSRRHNAKQRMVEQILWRFQRSAALQIVWAGDQLAAIRKDLALDQ